MIHNAIVLCHMLLACFPWIGNPELAAVQLIFEHVLTFDALLGRIVLTHEGYKKAQKLLPQLLILAARNNLVYPADLAPSFLNIFVIIQTIVDPLMANLTPEERTAVYATKQDAYKLSSLSLDRLQADVDQWVCEHSELDPLRPLSIASSTPLSIEDYAYNQSACDDGKGWWPSVLSAPAKLGFAQSGSPLVRKLAMRETNTQLNSNSDVTQTGTATISGSNDSQIPIYNPEDSKLGLLKPISSLESSPPSLQSRTHDLTAREHGDVWWKVFLPTQEQSCSAQPGPLLLRKSATRETKSTTTRTGSLAAVSNSKGHPDLPCNSELGLLEPLPAISSLLPFEEEPTYDLGVRGYGDVWWGAIPPTQARSRPAQPGPCFVRRPAVRETKNLEALCTTPDQTSACATSSELNVCASHPCDGAPRGAASPVSPTSPGLLGVDSGNSHLRPWTTPSNALSLSSFASSPTSFGPSTPMDRPYSPWECPLSEADHSVVLGSEASSEDLHTRSHVEIRKAKEATVQRKFVRKLKAALAVILPAYN